MNDYETSRKTIEDMDDESDDYVIGRKDAFTAAIEECQAYAESLNKDDIDKLTATQQIAVRIAQRARKDT